MTPLEAVARAICDDVLSGSAYEGVPVDDVFNDHAVFHDGRNTHIRDEILTIASKAILALSEAELPWDAITIGAQTMSVSGSANVFRIMVKAIALGATNELWGEVIELRNKYEAIKAESKQIAASLGMDEA